MIYCRPTLLCFENPAVPDSDLGRSSYMMPKIKRAFEHAHQLLQAALSDSTVESYLSYVIRADDALLLTRSPPEIGSLGSIGYHVEYLTGEKKSESSLSPDKKKRRRDDN
jgi:DNA polymerase sigma